MILVKNKQTNNKKHRFPSCVGNVCLQFQNSGGRGWKIRRSRLASVMQLV